MHAEFPSVGIGSYPLLENSDYSVQITLESKDGGDVDRALGRLLQLLDPTSIVRVV